MKIFRPTLFSRVMAVAFFLVTTGVCSYTFAALFQSESDAYLLLITVAILPFLLCIASFLRMLTLVSRRITLEAAHLDHRQFLKNHRVPYAAIRKVEVQKRGDGEIGTLRILWNGPRFYLDSTSVDGWYDLLSELEAKLIDQGPFVEVESFEPVDG